MPMDDRSGFLVILFVAVIYILVNQDEGIEISINQGRLKGVTLKSRNGTQFYGFRGVPYAKPPTGKLRLEPPQLPDPWNGTRDASKLPNICIQKSIFEFESATGIVGDEDCLYLNIYMPMLNKDDRELLPVLVFFHGGAFIEGSANFYGPDYIMDNRVVFVSINYRLAALGFLSAVDDVLPGNYGLKDQCAALKWIQENIVSFYGDPKRVTIFGESAGAASVHYHMHSHLSKGLFHQAITQSGSALAHWAQISPTIARERAKAFAILVGCSTESSRAMLNCFKRIPAKDFIRTHNKFHVWDIQPVIPFPPVVEPENVQNAFITKNPWNQKIVNDVPLITGFNSGEGAILVARYLSSNRNDAKIIDENYERLFPLIFSFGVWTDVEKHQTIAKAIKTYYFKDKPISEETALEFVDMISDGYFIYDSIEAASRHTNKLFMYYYDHRNENTFMKFFGNCSLDLGVSHGDDLQSLFNLRELNTNLEISNKADIEVSKRMVSYWINFAYTGNPGWQSTTPQNLQYLHISTEQDKLVKNILNDRYLFWKNLDLHSKHERVDVTSMKDEL